MNPFHQISPQYSSFQQYITTLLYSPKRIHTLEPSARRRTSVVPFRTDRLPSHLKIIRTSYTAQGTSLALLPDTGVLDLIRQIRSLIQYTTGSPIYRERPARTADLSSVVKNNRSTSLLHTFLWLACYSVAFHSS